MTEDSRYFKECIISFCIILFYQSISPSHMKDMKDKF